MPSPKICDKAKRFATQAAKTLVEALDSYGTYYTEDGTEFSVRNGQIQKTHSLEEGDEYEEYDTTYDIEIELSEVVPGPA